MVATPEEELPKRAILRAVQQNETGRAQQALILRFARPFRLDRPVYADPILTRKSRSGGHEYAVIQPMERTARQVGRIVESSIPARLDALPWSRFHTLVIVALGITWVLDGLEVTLAGAVSRALSQPSLQLSDAEVGLRRAPISPGLCWERFYSARSPTVSDASAFSS
jgi:hypothetical protein